VLTLSTLIQTISDMVVAAWHVYAHPIMKYTFTSIRNKATNRLSSNEFLIYFQAQILLSTL